jgi:hypothetical protein
MPRGDAVQERPTVADEMAKFSGFSTKDGDTIDAKTENLNPVTGKAADDGKPAEKKPDAKADDKPGAEGAADKGGKASKLTDEESEATITALDKKLGREASDAEIADALAAATAEKNKGADGAKPKKSVQDRINKSIRAQRAAERRADAAEARATAAEAALARGDMKPLTGDTKPANDGGEAAPDPKKFEFGELDAGYIRALARYEAKQELAADRQTQQKNQQTAQEREAAAKFKENLAAFEDAGADKYDDFEEVVLQGARDKVWPLSESLGALLFESDHGPDIAYMLASDVKLAKEVFGKTALQQAAWLGRQEAKLSAGTGAKVEDDKPGKSEDTGKTEAKVSKAPAPVARARGQGSNSSVPGDTTDFAAFEAAAMARQK